MKKTFEKVIAELTQERDFYKTLAEKYEEQLEVPTRRLIRRVKNDDNSRESRIAD